MSSLNYLNLARSLFRNFGAMKNFERCADKCRVVHADEGRLQVELDLQEEHANLHGTMHGGLTATLGISVDLSVSFLEPAKMGDTILVDGFVNRLGSTICFTGADIYRKSDGAKIATALHTCTYPRK
uniref:4HBT domain-containing protein n=1 Tax=Globodera pallida TaxID=36090 RepID=A0A183CLD4_GLOPA